MLRFVHSLRNGFAFGMGLFLAVATGGLVAVTVNETWTSFAPGDLVSASLLNANLNALKTAVEEADPPGTVVAFAGSAVPTGWLLCDGSAVNRGTYARLYTAIGTTYGAGDGAATFNVPDLRGEFIRGFDSGRGVDGGRSLGSMQTDQLQSHTHSDSGHAHGLHLYHDSWDGGPIQPQQSDLSAYVGQGQTDTGYASLGNPVVSTQGTPRHGAETRPRSVALNYIIKY